MDRNTPTQPLIPLRQKVILILFGLGLFLILVESGLRIGGFTVLSLRERRNKASLQRKGAFRIMCLGESTTAGGRDSFPSQLEAILNARNIGIKFSVINKGIEGTSTSAILSRLEYNFDRYKPDMVITMMGVNDGGAHIPYKDDSLSQIQHFLSSFKIYKLAKLIWLHAITKAKETGLYGPKVFTDSNMLQQAVSLQAKLKEGVKAEDSLQPYEKLPEEAIGLNHNDSKVYKDYLELGEYYADQGVYYADQQAFSRAKAILKKAIELNPDDSKAYFKLGRVYVGLMAFSWAEAMFKKAIELNPNDSAVYSSLGELYAEKGAFLQAEAILKKAIEANPKGVGAYNALGWFYAKKGAFLQADAMFRKGIGQDPNDSEGYTELGEYSIVQGRFSLAVDVFKKAIERGCKNAIVYRLLATIYQQTGKYGLAQEYFSKAVILNGYYKPITIKNYRRLSEILNKRRIKLICVQYPMRGIEPLKMVFRGIDDGIIFVDNEKLFKDAVKKAGYNEYFEDMFAGDFGHCTRKGYRLLAENIANIILKTYFNYPARIRRAFKHRDEG